MAAASTHISPIRISAVRPLWMLGSLMAADSLALVLAVVMSVLGGAIVTHHFDVSAYLRLSIFLPAFLAAYGTAGLYSGLTVHPPEELRCCMASSSVIFLLLGALAVSIHEGSKYVKPTLFFALAVSIVLVPLFRSLVRSRLARREWWGYPAVLFGSSSTTEHIVDAVRKDPGLGLKIAAVFDEHSTRRSVRGIPIINDMTALRPLRIEAPVYAVVTWSTWKNAKRMFEPAGWEFSHVLIIPDAFSEFSNLLVTPKAVGHLPALEMRQQMLMPGKRLAKRLLDCFLAALVTPVVLPLVALIALLIKLDSSGPAFFFQRRIGRGGKRFKVWKFRSMVVDAAAALENYLATNPKLRREWEENNKLKHDPRITRVGKFLRKTSLDELPQLWNVLIGDMSLVGPRPIVEAEIVRYGTFFESYKRVPGGITGLWQISGRNDTSYEERVSLDDYYVRNWSVWLDFYILSRTVSAILLRRGAY